MGSVSPFNMQATAVAQAPVPQAHVSPLPRSQTLMVTFFRSSTWINSVFTPSGKNGLCSNSGPIPLTSNPATSATWTTQWGFPMETQVPFMENASFSGICPSRMIPPHGFLSCSAIPPGTFPRSTGIKDGARIGAPMSTRTRSTLPSFLWSWRRLIPARVSTVISSFCVRLWSLTYFPTHRIPFPHIFPREPSALYISISKSA